MRNNGWWFCGLLAVGFVFGLAWGARAHEWYAGQTTDVEPYKGWSCCNGTDCKIVRAWQREDGKWVGVYNDVEYVVPDEAIKPDESNGEPFQASMCVYEGKVLCFWRKGFGG